MNKILFACSLMLVSAGLVLAQGVAEKKRVLPDQYGRVILNNYPAQSKMPAVVFDHWLHRSKFTCRICHVDLAFRLKAGASHITAADNMKGLYCGACHNGRTVHENRKIFGACSLNPSPGEQKRCERCHSQGRNVRKEYDFSAYTGTFPKDRFGNNIDWEKAETDGLIRPVDSFAGVTRKGNPTANAQELGPEQKSADLKEISFSHKKHAAWNSCEMCHPAIFDIKQGPSTYSKREMLEGKYCGACHLSVAFPMSSCQRCHSGMGPR